MDEAKSEDITHQSHHSNLSEYAKTPTLKKKLEPIGGNVDQGKKKGVNFSALAEPGEGSSQNSPAEVSLNHFNRPTHTAFSIEEKFPQKIKSTLSKEDNSRTTNNNGYDVDSSSNTNSQNPISKDRRLSYQDFSSPSKAPTTRVSHGGSFSQKRSNLGEVEPVSKLTVGTKFSHEMIKHESHSRTPSPPTPLEKKNSVKSGKSNKSQDGAHRSISKSKNQSNTLGIDPNRRISIADNLDALRHYISKDAPLEEENEGFGQQKGIVKSASIDDGEQLLPLLSADHNNGNKIRSRNPSQHSLVKGSVSNLNKSSHSLAQSRASSNGAPAAARELQDKKLIQMAWIFVSLVSNLLLLGVFILLHSDSGFLITFSGQSFRHSGLVILEFWMHLTYELTIFAMNDAAAALIGYFITRKRGFSLAACGFVHTSHLQKLSFAGKLGYRSPSRKFLSRISVLWLIQLVAALLPIFASASLSYQDYRYLSGTLTCEIFYEDGYMYDRGYPKVQTAMGVAELIFGNSFGILRSEQNVNVTTFVISPQLIDAASLTTVIQGDGYVASVSSSCICVPDIDVPTLQSIGYDAATAAALYSAAPTQDFTKPGFISNVAPPIRGRFNATTILTGSTACATTAEDIQLFPVCTTQIYDHKHASISMEFATDGSPASIAAVNAQILDIGEPANITWLYQSLVNILEGETSYFLLPQTYNGAVNPLMWWTTTNMIAVDPAILEPGIETMIGILLRSAVFRSFASKGYLCPQSVVNPDYLIIYISDFGYGMGIAFVVIELVILTLCIVAFIPWLRATKPLGPGVRIAHDRTYFTVMVNSAAVQAFGITPMLDTDVMWNKFDFVVRVGESKKTRDDPEFGQIMVDVPKFVSPFQNGKMYF
ncbi:hypothetical protein HDV06_005631 [Boothiomyces sp. JEL0866]|nr:hypothetical protein HDV06_005631 [Boothiomyces sp. JEL0866]